VLGLVDPGRAARPTRYDRITISFSFARGSDLDNLAVLSDYLELASK